VDAAGLKCNGILEVTSQSEALQRIKDMGLFPTRVKERNQHPARTVARPEWFTGFKGVSFTAVLFGRRVKPSAVAVFTRQLATLLNAGLPLLRGLRLLGQQESNYGFKAIIAELGMAIEEGSSLSEALAQHPKVFNRLYVNMVKAGEASGALELTLRRLAEFQEKAQRIRSRVKSAMFYPTAVMIVAGAILALMMIFVVPRFQQVFADLMGGRPMPAFTVWILWLSNIARHHAPLALGVLVLAGGGLAFWTRTEWGRWVFDRLKLNLPVLGNVVRQSALARFARTLGTLLGSGVPILQALTIVRETVGNVHVANVVSRIHDAVKGGDTVALPLRESGMFPPMVVGMVDVGEQTGALPDMLIRIADDCDEKVDDAVKAMTSLLEPVMIVFLAVVVGSIVIAMFLPIIIIINDGAGPVSGGDSGQE
jgi:type IV pilus assembly protein PilC